MSRVGGEGLARCPERSSAIVPRQRHTREPGVPEFIHQAATVDGARCYWPGDTRWTLVAMPAFRGASPHTPAAALRVPSAAWAVLGSRRRPALARSGWLVGSRPASSRSESLRTKRRRMAPEARLDSRLGFARRRSSERGSIRRADSVTCAALAPQRPEGTLKLRRVDNAALVARSFMHPVAGIAFSL